MSDRAEELRRQILELTAQYHAAKFPAREFVPGESVVPVSGKVIGAEDICSVVDSALDGWFTAGRFAREFERRLAKFVGVRSASLVNSGSSANLVALCALTSPKLGARQLKPGDEVLTVAAGFPTTVNPIFQNRLVPVFVDVSLPTYEIDASKLEAAYSPKMKAVMLAHTLGNVFDLDAVIGRSAGSTTCGSSRTAATRSARPTGVARWGRSATSLPSAFIPRTTSRWAKAARC